jgi:hypothetical protein
MKSSYSQRTLGRASALAFLLLAVLALLALVFRPSPVTQHRSGEQSGGAPSVAPTLEAGRILQGQVRIADGVDPRTLLMKLEVVDGFSTMSLAFPVNSRGGFSVMDLPSGNVRVTFVTGQGGDVVHTIENVPMEPPGVVTRLEVDLRECLHLFTFEVLGPFGEPATDVMLFWRRAREGGESDVYTSWVRGPSPRAITSTSEWIDVAVLASGARVLEIPALSFSRTLQLREGYPVRIALPEEVRPADDGVSVALRLVALEFNPRFERAAKRGRSLLEETGEYVLEGSEVECIVPALGVYEVRWRAYREVSKDGIQILHLEDQPGQVEVSPGSHATLFRPYFPLELYRAKLKDS